MKPEFIELIQRYRTQLIKDKGMTGRQLDTVMKSNTDTPLVFDTYINLSEL